MDERGGYGELAPRIARADLHCHSSASERSRLGVQRAAGLPECATPPREVYDLARRRGMDFVTITDHDTIAGVLEIAHLPGVFVSEELTASFRGEPQAVHVLCYGITPADHDWLQAHRGDVEACAFYMHERDIACALAHPYYTVAAPLTPRHRRRLAELFDIWEVRNGARPPELNHPAAAWVHTREATGIGGSDDHAGVDIGRTYTEVAGADTPAEFLARLRAGDALACGEEGSAAKWAHAAIAIAARSLGCPRGGEGRLPDAQRVLVLVSRLLSEGGAREGADVRDGGVSPQDARALLRAWMAAVELGELDGRELIELMQQESFRHADLYRRARTSHERKLRGAVADAVRAVGAGASTAGAQQAQLLDAARGIFDACAAAIPYAPAGAFLARERATLAAMPYTRPAPVRARTRERTECPRVAIVADGIGATHGVARTIEQIRRRGVPGFEIEVVGTDACVDRRLPEAASFEVPFYAGLRIGVPSLPAAVETLLEGRYELIHVCTPGPAGVAGALLARAMGLPLLGSYHTELGSYAELRTGDAMLTSAADTAVRAFYAACDVVLSPGPSSDAALAAAGLAGERVMRWDRGVDSELFRAAADVRPPSDGTLRVLYSGRVTLEKGVELLADAFLRACDREPRLRLVVAGGGPEEGLLRERLGGRLELLGWLEPDALAGAYAGADMFLFPSATDTFGQVILEAQASGLPVIAVARGGPVALIEQRVSGLLCEPDSDALADALVELARSPLLRETLAGGARRAVAERTWERALERLADGYRSALGPAEPLAGERAA